MSKVAWFLVLSLIPGCSWEGDLGDKNGWGDEVPGGIDDANPMAADLWGPEGLTADVLPDVGLEVSPGEPTQPTTDILIVANGVQTTASERNNARLILEDDAGVLHFVFYGEGIFHAFSSDGGATWSTPVSVAPDGRNPAMALDSKGVLHLVYREGRIAAHDIIHRSFAGGKWSGRDLIHHETLTMVARPSIAVGPGDNLHCVWQLMGIGETNSEILYKKYVPGVGWDTDPINISNTFGASEYPNVVADSKGSVFVVWKDSGDSPENDKMVLFRKFTPRAGWDAGFLNVSGTTGNGSFATMDPNVAVDSKDNLHLVWKDFQPGNKEILYKKYLDGVWDGEPTVVSRTETASDRPVISLDAQDNLFVAWSEKTDGVTFDVVWAAFRNGQWTPLENLSKTNGIDSLFPNTPTLVRDFIPLVWTEVENTNSSVMFRRIPLNVPR